ncbi:MAG: excinuclease ABC subunit UvrA [Furfurilactobacillus sp.]|jgi:excinuclease ABC subunit A|uniref:UvrABC system protein A n=1 Tax=Furfurilactobacillus milii TaxID=2888272 RepID=A0ABT6D8P7_9LACO|nr:MULTISPECIES: excinuclease ABC subunit UvrA [Furfurilactobacillus]QLE66817.1 Excinuclease ABC subunit A [Furfurilactobacillus rossiae]MCF6160703.1 excinuclease ABC subunit UvrA [Furfurilactobacillus milii]MCF6162935.1 excinuclease ABC subunit UvrA [Furfurilactobacillus milii]MCF6420145.1 excinuclease ABC subunit UvrA [Furfurilactobacillus milii]MCH4010412.1 excinuclease ABC subunit UvrA [Furfurilactobacillus sp.]
MAIQHKETIPDNIEVRGARVNNLKNVNVDIPLNAFVAITGRSGSGKSSLAMGVLYAEGARRYLNALSTYTRRRISQVGAANVESVQYLPSALALRQRPQVPGVRSTVGTMSESLNVLRLMFSRLGSTVCPNGHRVPPTIEVAENDGWIVCPTCGVRYRGRGAEDFAFNAGGACPTCGGVGEVRQIAADRLIGDENLTIREGAVASWHLAGRNFMPLVAEAVGIPIDVPYKDLSDEAKDLVLHGKKQPYAINIPSSKGKIFHMDNAMYENAFNAVEDSMANTTNERAIERLNKFYVFDTCPTCHGSRFDPALLNQLVVGHNIAEITKMDLDQLMKFADTIVPWLPKRVQHLGTDLVKEFKDSLTPLTDLGLNYLTLDRAGNTLSTGELQRIQLGRTLRSETTGVLYVLDEPSVGLHPANVTGLIKVFHQLVEQGNSLVVVDHDVSIIAAADYVIEIGPGAGKQGGQIVNHGTVATIRKHESSLIAPFLNGTAPIRERPQLTDKQLFAKGKLSIEVTNRFNISDVKAQFPKNRLSVVTGMSGAGKTTLVLDSLIPGILADVKHQQLPKQVKKLDRAKIHNVVMVDSVPVGKNVRSTVATYTSVLDTVRTLFANTKEAQEKGWTASHFSYNLNDGACPLCHGTGTISMDVQYLPDVEEVCPQCHGQRYNQETLSVKWHDLSIADILALSVDDARNLFVDVPSVANTLGALHDMGLGYLELGESTPTLSGGEAQRLKLVSRMGRRQSGTLFVFDEPSVGLHPLDIQQLLRVFDQLINEGATVIVIEHDLDVMANADYIVDMGPEGGTKGGQLVAAGTPAEVAQTKTSVTGQYLKEKLAGGPVTA